MPLWQGGTLVQHSGDNEVRATELIMRVVALLAAYNEERFIGDCLEYLIEQGIEAYLIDNCSTDRTVEIARQYLGHGLVNIETLPRPDGLNRLKVRLQRKDELATSLDADWFMHMDPDEIRLPPHQDQTLAEAFEEVDAKGYNAVNFLEFTFIPTLESPEHDHPDFQQTMRWYYPFAPGFPHHIKAWKKQPVEIGLANGGHRPKIPNMLLYPESFKMRHYQFLSLEQARKQYLQDNALDRSDVKTAYWRGWLVEERMSLPSKSELNTYTADGDLSLDKPRTRHVMEDWALPESARREENLCHYSARDYSSANTREDAEQPTPYQSARSQNKEPSKKDPGPAQKYSNKDEGQRLFQEENNRLKKRIFALERHIERLNRHYSSRRYTLVDAIFDKASRLKRLIR